MSPRGGPQFIPRPAESLPGRPAPWAALAEGSLSFDLDHVRRILPPGRRGRPSPVEDEGAAPSAVLVALFEAGDGPHVLLTRRSWGLRTHRGEVAFPGGRVEAGETAAEAALREAWEEVGLAPGAVEVLGELDHLTTVTRRAYIVPVVGLLDGTPDLEANPEEVDEVLLVPVAELLLAEVYREERWGPPAMNRPIYFFELVGDTVWGATAAMLRQLLARLLGVPTGDPTDVDPARGVPMGYRPLPGSSGGVV